MNPLVFFPHAVDAQTFTGEHLLTLIKKLVSLDRNWIPSEPGHSL